ncbi:Dual Specificity Testis-Specific Protein Kinase 2 [Manis pentadactyla]|nr:Dual Specificity Testis-Specific Protein Kinase 2 [Manis pentadactyla]
MPDRLLEGGSMVEQLKQMVTSYEALANVTAPMDCDPLPPKYEQDNELLPPKYEQGLLKEEQQCEKEPPESGQHGTHGIQHGPAFRESNLALGTAHNGDGASQAQNDPSGLPERPAGAGSSDEVEVESRGGIIVVSLLKHRSYDIISTTEIPLQEKVAETSPYSTAISVERDVDSGHDWKIVLQERWNVIPCNFLFHFSSSMMQKRWLTITCVPEKLQSSDISHRLLTVRQVEKK